MTPHPRPSTPLRPDGLRPRTHPRMRPGAALAPALLAAAAACCALGACSSLAFDFPEESRPVRLPPSGKPALDLSKIDMRALAVERIRVHPLTRWEDGDEARLLVHVEFRDRFGHATKGFGELRIELFRPGETSQVQDAVWSVDLIDPDNNARYYDDLVSRTYQISISDAPEWARTFAAETDEDAWMRVKAYFRTLDEHGRERVLQDDLRIEP